MMNGTTALQAQAHPAPHRGRVGLLALTLGLTGAPLAWGLHLVASYAITSHSCFPGAAPRSAVPLHSQGLSWLLIALDLAAIVVAAVAVLVSHRSWQSTRREFPGHAGDLIDIGEGRTRFLSLWGMLTSAGFMIAIAIDLVGLWILPLCA
jgi:hypothetical protein